ncbi:TROVE domain-containing protein [bacterium]|nr:TROVE domain-containing protein [bacterium]
MSKLNVKNANYPKTHEGATASTIKPEEQLRRSVMSCLLWEDGFYESGQTVAERIKATIPYVKPEEAFNIAIEAREKMNIWHVGLLILREMAKLQTHKHLVAEGLEKIIKRPDEMGEFLAIYWKDGKVPLSKQVKKGIGNAFKKFDEYQLAKYNRKVAVKLRDILFLTHPKPKDKEQEDLWKRLISDELQIPDTWETALSSGEDKKTAWERLLKEKKLSGLALIRNLRNMNAVDVDPELIKSALINMKTEKVLPFRFVAAQPYAEKFEKELEDAMLRAISSMPKLKGKTLLLCDASASMLSYISRKSDMSRFDASNGLAVLMKEICENLQIFTFSNKVVEVKEDVRGFELVKAISKSQEAMGTYLGKALKEINKIEYDRIVIITDEQSADKIPPPNGKGYIINIANYEKGIGYDEWIHINGWSEAVISYITELEKAEETEKIEEK